MESVLLSASVLSPWDSNEGRKEQVCLGVGQDSLQKQGSLSLIPEVGPSTPCASGEECAVGTCPALLPGMLPSRVHKACAGHRSWKLEWVCYPHSVFWTIGPTIDQVELISAFAQQIFGCLLCSRHCPV